MTAMTRRELLSATIMAALGLILGYALAQASVSRDVTYVVGSALLTESLGLYGGVPSGLLTEASPAAVPIPGWLVVDNRTWGSLVLLSMLEDGTPIDITFTFNGTEQRTVNGVWRYDWNMTGDPVAVLEIPETADGYQLSYTNATGVIRLPPFTTVTVVAIYSAPAEEGAPPTPPPARPPERPAWWPTWAWPPAGVPPEALPYLLLLLILLLILLLLLLAAAALARRRRVVIEIG